MAKCFDVTGYIEPCNTVRQKYTGRALLITGRGDGGIRPTFSENGIKVVDLYGARDFDNQSTGLLATWKADDGKALPVMINAQNPFGVTIQGNTDSGRVMYIKIIPVSIPATRDGKAEEFIMGLQKGLYGDAIVILERELLFSTAEIGYVENDIFGAYSPVRLDPTSVTRNEYENGGAWSFNLVCEEPVPNVICTMSGLELALDTLNA